MGGIWEGRAEDLGLRRSLRGEFQRSSSGKGDGPEGPSLPRQRGGLASLIGSVGHDRRDLRKDRADAGGHVRHNRAGGYGHETSHKSVLDEILSARVLPDLEFQYQILHCFFSSARQVSAADANLTLGVT